MTTETEVHPANAGTDDIVYVLDSADRIVALAGDWGPLEAAGVSASALMGISIFEFVKGHFTRRFLRDFLEIARTSETPVLRQYRCDTPQLRRAMEMEASVTPAGLRLAHRLVAQEAFPFDVQTQAVSAGAARYHRCSICCRLRMKRADTWLEPDLCLGRDQTALVIHTVCPDCRNHLRERELHVRPRS